MWGFFSYIGGETKKGCLPPSLRPNIAGNTSFFPCSFSLGEHKEGKQIVGRLEIGQRCLRPSVCPFSRGEAVGFGGIREMGGGGEGGSPTKKWKRWIPSYSSYSLSSNTTARTNICSKKNAAEDWQIWRRERKGDDLVHSPPGVMGRERVLGRDDRQKLQASVCAAVTQGCTVVLCSILRRTILSMREAIQK